jgi:phosphatidylethanolamine-binding protein (PEBP) family uncharacterized protein
MKARILAMLLALTAVARADDEFKLESPDVGPDKEFASDFVYDAFGCSGGNQSFALNWSGAPQGTQSFAITTFDPDALGGKGFWHWFMIDITSRPRPPHWNAMQATATTPNCQPGPVS